MNIICTSLKKMAKKITDMRSYVVLFGAGAIGRISTPMILRDYGLLDRVECYVDNNAKAWGEHINVCGKELEVRSPKVIEEHPSNLAIILNISRYTDILNQLETMKLSDDVACYLMPMMLVHNYCFEKSNGQSNKSTEQLIPKKLHYMWLGGAELPDTLKKCIDSWEKYCPDYEIIRWDENNYDIDKHPYMKAAYTAKAYGFVPDYARLDILYNEGGIYLDTDVEIKRNIDDLLFQEAFCGVEKWQIINFGGMSGAVKGHPMVKKFLDAREDILFINPDGSQNRNTCGYYDTKVALDNGYRIDGTTQCINGMNIYAYDYFHPYDYMTGSLNMTENTHSVHWFNGGWLDDKMREANKESQRAYEKLYKEALRNQ